MKELDKDIDALYVGLKKTAHSGVNLGLDFIFNGLGKVVLFILSFIASWSILWMLFTGDNPLICHFPLAVILLPFMIFGFYGYALHRRDVKKRKQDALDYARMNRDSE
jgi:hypothetical protein